MALFMEKEQYSIKVDKRSKGFLGIILNNRESSLILMEIFMREVLKMKINRVMVNIYILLEMFIKVYSKKEKDVGLVK